MRKLIATLLIAVSTIASAATQSEVCSDVGFLAATIMAARQNGTTYPQQMRANDNLRGRNGSNAWFDVANGLAATAHSVQIMPTHDERALVIKMFKERKELECYKEKAQEEREAQTRSEEYLKKYDVLINPNAWMKK